MDDCQFQRGSQRFAFSVRKNTNMPQGPHRPVPIKYHVECVKAHALESIKMHKTKKPVYGAIR